MKKFILLFTLAAFCIMAKAQDPVFNKGDQVINLGLGIGSTLYSGSYYKSSVPPLSVSYEKGIVEGILDKGTVGVGGYLGFSKYKWESDWFGDSYGYKVSNIILAGRGAFHYPFLDKLDTYAGLLIGFNIASSKNYGTYSGYTSSAGSGLVYSGFIGARYYFTDNIAALAELGSGIAYLNLGIAIKL